MSRPGWKSGSPVNGSCRRPKTDDSQPATGQIDGVARASACWLSTCDFTDASRLSSDAEQVAQDAERAFGRLRGPARRRRRQRRRRRRPPATGPRPAAFGDGLLGRRVELGLLAQLGERRLQRRNLLGQLAGGLAVALVFEAQALVGRPEGLELRAGRRPGRPSPSGAAGPAPRRPWPGQAQDPAGDRQPPDGSRFSVRDENCVTR